MVELAMVLILLVMLLVGIVSAAVAYGRGNSIQNAAREASRYAATLPDVESNLSEVILVAQAAASGDLDSTVPGFFACVVYVDGKGAFHRHIEGDASAITEAAECYDDQRATDEKRIQVVAGRTSEMSAVLFTFDINLRSEAAARYERG